MTALIYVLKVLIVADIFPFTTENRYINASNLTSTSPNRFLCDMSKIKNIAVRGTVMSEFKSTFTVN